MIAKLTVSDDGLTVTRKIHRIAPSPLALDLLPLTWS